MAERGPLGVWLYGKRVAEITTRKRPGEVICQYTEEALNTWERGTPLLSCSLPLAARAYKQAAPYFRGMLPEGQALQAMADVARVPTYDTFGMLERFGRDVAGAAVISATDPEQRVGDALPYTGADLADEVAGIDDRPLALYDDSELSLAGLQNKLLLIETPDGWARPIGGRPSTHILKVEDRRYPGLVTMEAACLRMAREVGLTDIDATVERLADVDCLIVSRFDRRRRDGGVTRVHQEDACQALGVNPEAAARRGKYEYAGGPSLSAVAGVLDTYADAAVDELLRLVAAVTFTVIIGNADAHGKNISLVHTQPGRVRLAPLYDTVPTVLWERLPDRAAMTVNGVATLSRVTLDDLATEAASWRVDHKVAQRTASETVERVLDVLTHVEVPDRLKEHIGGRCNLLLGTTRSG